MSGTALQALYNNCLPSVESRFIAKEVRQSCGLFKSSCLRSQRIHHLSRDLVMITAAATAAKSLQSCLTLCDSIDGSPPGSPVPGILQARTLKWVAISFSNALN